MFARDVMDMKDSFESVYFIDEGPKKSLLKPLLRSKAPMSPAASSPISIFSPLAPIVPEIKLLAEPLPKSVVEVAEAPTLPASSVWGNAHKLVLARRSRRAALEDIVDEYMGQEMDYRANLPTKTTHLEKKSEQNVKAMERGLLKKHWAKHRAVKAAADESHKTFLEAWEAEGEVESHPSKLRKYSATKLKVEKIRRNERRAARDAKCFDPYDAVEYAALDAWPAEAAPKKSHKQWPPVLPVCTTLHSEDIIEEVLEEKLDVRLPVKSSGYGAQAERRTKEKEYGLLKKHWVKHRAVKRAANEAHEKFLAEWEAEDEVTHPLLTSALPLLAIALRFSCAALVAASSPTSHPRPAGDGGAPTAQDPSQERRQAGEDAAQSAARRSRREVLRPIRRFRVCRARGARGEGCS